MKNSTNPSLWQQWIGQSRFLVFDTETSGLQPGYNTILSITWQIVENGTTVKNVTHYFDWPDDTDRVASSAIEINGLTQEELTNRGTSDKSEILSQFVEDVNTCQLIVAHNGRFDLNFIQAECKAHDVQFQQTCRLFDTMLSSIEICRIPSPYHKYKWPKLFELAEHLDIDMSALHLHESSADVELTRLCFIKLIQTEDIPFHHFFSA